HWGQVRVIPEDTDALDVYVSGVIMESSGQRLKLQVTVSDATGRTWFRKTYEQIADTRSYKDTRSVKRDPFQNLYSNLANDMLAYRQQLAGNDLENVRRVAKLQFPSDFAAYRLTYKMGEGKKQ